MSVTKSGQKEDPEMVQKVVIFSFPRARARARARGDKINFVLEMHRSLPCFDVTSGPQK